MTDISVSLSTSFDGEPLNLPSWLLSTLVMNLLVGVAFAILAALRSFGLSPLVAGPGIILSIYCLVAQSALYVRRMHYRNKSGWHLLWFFGLPIFATLAVFSRGLLAGGILASVLLSFQGLLVGIGLLMALQVDYDDSDPHRHGKMAWNILALLLCILLVVAHYLASGDAPSPRPEAPAVPAEVEAPAPIPVAPEPPPRQNARKAPHAIPAGNAFWHDGNLHRQWQKSRRSFPECKSASQYEQKALAFFDSPPKGTLFKQRDNGDRLYYHPSSNTFGVTTGEGAVKCFFRPQEKMAYWRRQK